MTVDKSMNILIVDDYKTMLRIIRNLLTRPSREPNRWAQKILFISVGCLCPSLARCSLYLMQRSARKSRAHGALKLGLSPTGSLTMPLA